MTRPPRIGFWNINGYNSSMLRNKLGTDDFKDVINKHDILAIVETHTTYDAELNIRNLYVATENKNAIWCKLDSTFFNFHKDIYLETVSVSPSNFERSKSVDLIRELDAKMLPFFYKRAILSFRVISMHEPAICKKRYQTMTMLS